MIDKAHASDFIHEALTMVDLPHLGRTLVAARPIAEGTLLLRELPLITSVKELPRALTAARDADAAAPDADTVKNAHAFACARADAQARGGHRAEDGGVDVL